MGSKARALTMPQHHHLSGTGRPAVHPKWPELFPDRHQAPGPGRSQFLNQHREEAGCGVPLVHQPSWADGDPAMSSDLAKGQIGGVRAEV